MFVCGNMKLEDEYRKWKSDENNEHKNKKLSFFLC